MTQTPDRFRLGVDEIHKYLRDELGLSLSKRQVTWWIETGRLRTGKCGRRRIASEKTLYEDVAAFASGEAADQAA